MTIRGTYKACTPQKARDLNWLAPGSPTGIFFAGRWKGSKKNTTPWATFCCQSLSHTSTDFKGGLQPLRKQIAIKIRRKDAAWQPKQRNLISAPTSSSDLLWTSEQGITCYWFLVSSLRHSRVNHRCTHQLQINHEPTVADMSENSDLHLSLCFPHV